MTVVITEALFRFQPEEKLLITQSVNILKHRLPYKCFLNHMSFFFDRIAAFYSSLSCFFFIPNQIFQKLKSEYEVGLTDYR